MLYHYLKYGIVKKEALRELTSLYFNPPTHPDLLKNNEANDLLYLLGLHAIIICENPKKTLRFANFIKTVYKTDEGKGTPTPYSFFIKISVADAYYKLGRYDKVSTIYYALSEDYKKSDNLLTPFMKMLFHCLKIKMLLNARRESDIQNEVKCINAISNESGYKVSRLYILSLLLNNSKFGNTNPEFQKQLNYSFVKLIRDNGLSNSIILPVQVNA